MTEFTEKTLQNQAGDICIHSLHLYYLRSQIGSSHENLLRKMGLDEYESKYLAHHLLEAEQPDKLGRLLTVLREMTAQRHEVKS